MGQPDLTHDESQSQPHPVSEAGHGRGSEAELAAFTRLLDRTEDELRQTCDLALKLGLDSNGVSIARADFSEAIDGLRMSMPT